MGLKYPYYFNEIHSGILAIIRECFDTRNTGYIAWNSKQDLYQLKWLIDDALAKCPTFEPEESWLKEQDKKRMWNNLKGK